MTPEWQKLASLAQEIYTLWFQFFGVVFASKRYPFKNIFKSYQHRYINLMRHFITAKEKNVLHLVTLTKSMT